MGPLFGEVGGGLLPFTLVLVRNDVKPKDTRYPMVPYTPQSFFSTSAASTSHIWIWTSLYYRFYWILIFQNTMWGLGANLEIQLLPKRSLWSMKQKFRLTHHSVNLPPPQPYESATTSHTIHCIHCWQGVSETNDKNKNFPQMVSLYCGYRWTNRLIKQGLGCSL